LPGSFTIEGLRVLHRDVINPVYVDEIGLTLSNGASFITSAPFAPTLTTATAPNALSGDIVGSPVVVAGLRNWGLNFTRVAGAQGEIREIRSGFTYREGMGSGSLNVSAVPTAFTDFSGVTARFRIEEVVPQSAWGARYLEMTLVDANGDPHPYAAIAGAWFQSRAINPSGGVWSSSTITAGNSMNRGFRGDPVGFHNVVPTGGATVASNGVAWTGGGTFGTVHEVQTIFSPDGRSVSVIGLEPHEAHRNRTRLDVQLYISTDVNFDGPVYVSLTNRGQGHWDDPAYIYPENLLHIANVNKMLDLETTVTNVNIGFQSVPVADIHITEASYGILRRGGTISVGLTEFGLAGARTDLGFNNIRQQDLAVAGNAIDQNRAALTVAQAHGAAEINMSVTRESRLSGSTVSMQGLHIYVNHSVPFGTYGVIVRGSAILDNDAFVINRVTPGNIGTLPLASTQPGFRRYLFGGLTHEPYINVITPGQGLGAGAVRNLVIAHAPSNSIYVDGVAVTLTNAQGATVTTENIGGRLFVPLRAVSEQFGAHVEFIEGAPAAGLAHRVRVSLNNITAVWVIGEAYYYVDGVQFPMATGGVVTRAVISNEGANRGTTILPIRYIAQAFGIPLADNVGGSAVLNPTAAQLAGVVTLPDVVNGNGNGNGNGGE
jgi:hypothetical protein